MNHLPRRQFAAAHDQIAPPQLHGIYANLLSTHVQMPFHAKQSLRRAKAAKSAVRCGVGQHHARIDAHVLNVIRPCGVNGTTGQNHWRQRDIRAAIHAHGRVQGQDFAVFVVRRFDAHLARVALGRGLHIFDAIVNNFNRLPRLHRQQRCMPCDNRRIIFLAAKTAARRRLNDLNALIWLIKQVFDGRVHVIRTLQRTFDAHRKRLLGPALVGQVVFVQKDFRNHTLWLDIRLLLRARFVHTGHNMRCVVKHLGKLRFTDIGRTFCSRNFFSTLSRLC